MNAVTRAAGAQMVAISWRSNRRQLGSWALGMVALFAATAFSINNLYGTSAELRAYAEATTADTAIYAINGRPFGLDNVGGVVVYEFAFISMIAIPLMAVMLMTRMTRLEEQTGRMELVRAGVVERTAALRAAAVLTTSSLVAVALGMVVILAVLGSSWPGAVLYPLAMFLLGLTFAALAALGAQLVAHARGVRSLGVCVLVIAFAARGVGDVRESAWVWVSPLGWVEQTRAFGEARWWPILPLIALTLIGFTAAVHLAGRRDLGEGLFAQRRGSTRAHRVLLGNYGFAARQHRNAVVGWSILAALVGASFGSLGDAFDTVTRDNATLRDVLGAGSAASNAFVSFVVMVIALVCQGFAVSGVARAAEEESRGRLEAMLAGERSRPAWLTAHTAALAVGTSVIALAGGLGLGISNSISTGDSTQTWRLVGAALAYLPAAFVLLALAVAFYGFRPGRVWIAWVVFTVVSVVAVLGDTLQVPAWLQNVSPMTWTGRVPLEQANPTALVGALAAALVLSAVALGAFRTRDIPTH